MTDLIKAKVPFTSLSEGALGLGVCPTCDLGFDLALHLQRVHEDSAVADEAGAGDASVRLAESLLFKVLPVTDMSTEKMHTVRFTRRARRETK